MLARLFIVSMLFTVPAAARDLVIDNVSGSDYQNDRGLVAGSASYGPYRSIARALLVAGPGDRIVITNTGVAYRECISLNGTQHSGVPGLPFQIIGNGVVLDGTTEAQPQAWQAVRGDLYRYNSLRPGYAQLLSNGGNLPQYIAAGGDLSLIKAGQWAFQHGYLYYRCEANTSPVDLALEVTTESVGITLYDVQHVQIRDLTVRGYRLDGINAHDKATGIELIGVAARHNGRSGICVGGSSRVVIASSVCELNTHSQLLSQGQSHTFLSDVKLAAGMGQDVTIHGGHVQKIPAKK